MYGYDDVASSRNIDKLSRRCGGLMLMIVFSQPSRQIMITMAPSWYTHCKQRQKIWAIGLI